MSETMIETLYWCADEGVAGQWVLTRKRDGGSMVRRTVIKGYGPDDEDRVRARLARAS